MKQNIIKTRLTLFLVLFTLLFSNVAFAYHSLPEEVEVSFDIREDSVLVGDTIHVDVSATSNLALFMISYKEEGGEWHNKICLFRLNCSFTFETQRFAPGTYTFRGKATNILFNRFYSDYDSVVVNDVVPEFDAYPEIEFDVTESTVTVGDTIHIEVSATDDKGLTKIGYQQLDGTWIEFNCNDALTCSHTFTTTRNEAGTYQFRGRAFDNGGHFTLSGYDSVVVEGEIECSSDLDCGEDTYVGESYCSGDDVYQNYREYSCVNAETEESYCEFDDTPNLIEECDYGCADGECLEEPGEIECYTDEECGTDGLVDEPECVDDDVHQTYRSYTCHYPGTYNSYCSDGDTLILIEDCGEDSYSEWSVDYCDGDDVYHSRAFYNRGCSDGACFVYAVIQEELVEECDYECADGECSEEPEIECYTDADCDDSNQYTEDTCVNPGTPASYCSYESLECLDEETQLCPLQQGVCEGSDQTCADNEWPGCTASSYGPDYEVIETSCDWLDNDCDGVVDEGCNVPCSDNSDCGTDGLVGEPTCSNNDVYQDYRTYTCNNPGTYYSYCSDNDDLLLKQECDDCQEGSCVEKEIYPRRQVLWARLSIIDDEARPGEDLRLLVNLHNEDSYDMEDVKITATIPELGIRRRAGPFNLRDGQEITKSILLYIPGYVEPGKYDVRVVISEAGVIKRIKHREITIV